MRLVDLDNVKFYRTRSRGNGKALIADTVEEVITELFNELPTVEAIPFKWTPFKKQKPPKTDDYLITYPLGVGWARYVTVATWHSVLEIWEGFRTEAVIAWAEIPKPYGDEL